MNGIVLITYQIVYNASTKSKKRDALQILLR